MLPRRSRELALRALVRAGRCLARGRCPHTPDLRLSLSSSVSLHIPPTKFGLEPLGHALDLSRWRVPQVGRKGVDHPAILYGNGSFAGDKVSALKLPFVGSSRTSLGAGDALEETPNSAPGRSLLEPEPMACHGFEVQGITRDEQPSLRQGLAGPTPHFETVMPRPCPRPRTPSAGIRPRARPCCPDGRYRSDAEGGCGIGRS